MSKTWYGHHIDTIKGNDYVLFKDYLELDKTIEEKDKEISRLNNIIEKIDQHLIDSGVDDEILKCCDIYDVNGVELRKYIEELKEGKE